MVEEQTLDLRTTHLIFTFSLQLYVLSAASLISLHSPSLLLWSIKSFSLPLSPQLTTAASQSCQPSLT